MMVTNPIAHAFLQRLHDARASSKGSVHRLSEYLTKKTFLLGKPYSFKGHEYQQAICDCSESIVSTIKPSQVGLSELSARVALATLATTPGARVMYAGPSVKWIQHFVKSRIDSVIYESPHLRELMRAGSDSSSLKVIGTSQLHTAGLYQGHPVISIPVDTLVVDEVDFCSEESIRTAESRLSHSPFVDPVTGVRGLRRFFSTPTGEDVGISAWYGQSDKRKRLCRCKSCKKWFWPGELNLLVVDGYDRSFEEMTATDVATLERRGLLDTARMICPYCRNTVTKDNLMPDYRQWVAENYGVKGHAGFWVDVFSVPDYHTPASVMRKLLSYGNDIGNFRNFTLGHPYSDATNSVLAGVVESNSTVTPIPPDVAASTGIRGCLLGLDVGKISYIVIGKRVGDTLRVVWTEQIRLQNPDGSDLVERVLALCKAYHICFGAMDAYPYSDSCLKILNSWPALRAADFTLRDKTLPMHVSKEDSKEIRANRTKLLDLLVKRVNNGSTLFPQHNESLVVGEHLRALRKIKREKDSGEKVEEWVSSKADHYALAMAYLVLADHVIEDEFSISFAAPASIKQAVPGRLYRPTRAA